jgi:hypothetical protein
MVKDRTVPFQNQPNPRIKLIDTMSHEKYTQENEVPFSICTAIADQMTMYLLQLGLNEPQDKLFEGIRSTLREAELSNPESKEVFNKHIPINFGLLNPLYNSVKFTLKAKVQEALGGIIGTFVLQYDYDYASAGTNGNSATIMVVPKNPHFQRLDYVVMTEQQFIAGTNWQERSAREAQKQKDAQ